LIDFKDIFENYSEKYHELVKNEDIKILLDEINEIIDLRNINIVEFGAGTGRLTIQLSKFANKIVAFEKSEGMLKTALTNLKELKITNCSIQKGDNLNIIELDEEFDLAIEGWSFLASILSTSKGFEIDNSMHLLNLQINNMIRNTKINSPLIIIESLGTYVDEPKPFDKWLPIYNCLENELHFDKKIVRTDFNFSTIEEAIVLFSFFFGAEYKSRIVQEQKTIIPEFTGIWYKFNDKILLL
jgi:SAM-dependent methyltransferase